MDCVFAVKNDVHVQCEEPTAQCNESASAELSLHNDVTSS